MTFRICRISFLPQGRKGKVDRTACFAGALYLAMFANIDKCNLSGCLKLDGISG